MKTGKWSSFRKILFSVFFPFLLFRVSRAEFPESSYFFNISEGDVTAPDALCALARLPVADFGEDGGGATYSSTILTGNPNQVTVTIKEEPAQNCLQNCLGLDREEVSVFEFQYNAEKDGIMASTKIILNLLDVNDNSPDIEAVPDIDFKETETVNTFVYNISASDKDEGVNGTVLYSNISRCDDHFRIDPNTGEIRNKVAIDREVDDSFECTVEVSDRANTAPLRSFVTFTINIVDVNDNPPKCLLSQQEEITVKMVPVKEHHSLVVVICNLIQDDDYLDNGKFDNASLFSNPYPDLFNVIIISSAAFQNIRLNIIGLDFEKGDRYDLQLRIYDKGEPQLYSNVSITVLVEDVNDNEPQCFPPFSSFISESVTDISSPIGSLNCSDADSNGITKYILLAARRGNLTLNSIRISSTGQIFIDSTADIDLDEPSSIDSILLTFAVIDDSLGSNVTNKVEYNFTLYIQDENDNSPSFLDDTFSFNVSEGLPRGAYVGQLRASDKDSGDNGIVEYKISDPDKPFSIDANTGIINTTAKLDREDVEKYSFVLLACDRGSTPRTGNTTVFITVTDIDDNCPTFSATSYNFTAYGDDYEGRVIGNLTAKDEDATPKFIFSVNRDVHFGVIESNGSLIVNRLPEVETIENLTAYLTGPGQGRSCDRYQANVSIAFLINATRQPVTPTELKDGTLDLVSKVVIAAIAGFLLVCAALVIFCVCVLVYKRRYHMKSYDFPTSSSSPLPETRRKSILKNYTERNDSNRQKNSVRFIDVIPKTNVFLFDAADPPSSPTLNNGNSHHQSGAPLRVESSVESISSGGNYEDDYLSLTSDSSSHQQQSMNGNIHVIFEEEIPLDNYRPPTPPRRRPVEEHSLLQEREGITFGTDRQGNGDIHMPVGYHREKPWSRQYPRDQMGHPNDNRIDYPHDSSMRVQNGHVQSYMSETNETNSFLSDDKDSISSDFDNYSTFTEPGTDIIERGPGPMESLMSQLHQSTTSGRSVVTCNDTSAIPVEVYRMLK